MKKVTQQDIANALNISRTTVARALNDSGPVDPKTKEIILKKAKEMGYKTNPIAKSLAMKKQVNIYVFLVESYNYNLKKKIEAGLRSIEKEFKPFNVKLNIHKTRAENPEDQVKIIKSTLEENTVDGIILSPAIVGEEYSDIRELIGSLKIPMVTVNLDLPDSERLAYIGPDYFRGGALAAEILANYIGQEGKVGVISSALHYESNDRRLEGFMKKMEQYPSIDIIGPYMIHDIQDNYDYTKKILTNKENLKAIYTTTDIVYVYKAIKDQGVEGIKLIGNDLTDEIKELIKKGEIHASIHQRPYLQGYLAGKNLLRKIIFQEKPDKSKIYTGFDVACQENIELEEMYSLNFS